ncbi:hypothetical protein ATY77_19250 [Rhizobium sp. R634]|uniref:hypothetical protein n=1 Tax=Rhizobium sp. R634 TaxID=1764274 RepID=UPI000B536C77|nr:hypothetical protein [Rhizobium sp. R634]OWV70176.1 hypothetical protein ATY77_19250 [Rhizobium sp. R634]
MRSWYERYGVWIALAAFVFISVISFAGFSQTQQLLKMTCSPGDKGDCFRQWVSATSGWFGGAVTFATLIFLSRQVNDMRLHHRETMRHATRPVYLRAQRLKDAVNSARITLKLLKQVIREGDQEAPTMDLLFSMMAGLRSLQEQLSRPEFDNFENEIGYAGIGSAFMLRTNLRPVLEIGNLLVDALKHDPRQQINVADFKRFRGRAEPHDFMELYFSNVLAEADKQIEAWERTMEETKLI